VFRRRRGTLELAVPRLQALEEFRLAASRAVPFNYDNALFVKVGFFGRGLAAMTQVPVNFETQQRKQREIRLASIIRGRVAPARKAGNRPLSAR
jgi:hypothetical protein